MADDYDASLMEDIYQRAEGKFVSDSAKANWLKGFNFKGNKYERQGAILSDYFERGENLQRSLGSARTVEDFSRIMDEAEETPYYGQEVYSDASFQRKLLMDKEEMDEVKARIRAKEEDKAEDILLEEDEEQKEIDKQRIRRIDNDKRVRANARRKERKLAERIALGEDIEDIDFDEL